VRQQRRHHPRLAIPLETQLQLAGSEEWLSATIQDLSAGGAGLLTTFEVHPGTDIDRIHFELPAYADQEAQLVEVAARAMRSVPKAGLGGEAEYLLGVQFVDITRELFDRIQQFVFLRLRSEQKERVPLERAIAIRFDRFDDFVDEVSVNLSATGMFIRTREPRPPGAVFNFQFQLGEDFSLIEGRAEVIWRRRLSEGPDRPPGMGVKFLNLDVPSQKLIDRLIAQQEDAEPRTVEAEPAAPSEVTKPEPTAAAMAEEEPPLPPQPERAEATIVSLGNFDAVRRQVGELRGELEEAHRHHEQRLQELRSRLEDRQAAANSELEARLRDAEAAHKDSERQRGELRSELEGAREEAAELRQQLAESPSKEELLRLTNEHEELQVAGDKLRFELDQARTELTSELERAREDATELRDGLESAQAEIERLKQSRDERIQQLQAEHAQDVEQAVADARRETVAEAENRLNEVRTELDQARGEADELRRQLEERDRTVADLGGELEDARSEIQQLQADHAQSLEQAVAETRQEAGAEAESRLGEVRSELDQARSEADELRRQLEEQQQSGDARLEELRDELTAAAQEERDLQQKLVIAAREERDQVEEAAARERESLQELADTAAREAAAERVALHQELTAARELGDRLEHELESLRQKLDEARQPAAGEAGAPLTAAESHRLRSELESSERLRREIEAEIRQLRGEASLVERQAAERESALRAELENATSAAAGGAAAPTDQSRRPRRALSIAALLLVGAVLGILVVSLIRPMRSSAEGPRPVSANTDLATPPEPVSVASEPELVPTAPSAPLEAEPTTPPAAEPSAVEEPASAEPEAEPTPDPASAEQAVRDWASAWSDQRVDDYLESYSDSFQPADGQSRDSWAATRRQRIERPRSIEVSIDAVSTVEISPGRVSVSFDQGYSSDTYSDRVRKTAILVWEDGAWRIAEERVIE
jgi:uncharacterized protein (TIGR02266 family)